MNLEYIQNIYFLPDKIAAVTWGFDISNISFYATSSLDWRTSILSQSYGFLSEWRRPIGQIWNDELSTWLYDLLYLQQTYNF